MGLRRLRIALFAVAGVGFVVLAMTAAELIRAGDHADVTATLTPSSEGLWIRAILSFSVMVEALVGLSWIVLRPSHPRLLLASALLFSLSLALFAFDVYWWNAAGSYADMADKPIPPSAWKTYPVMGMSLLATIGFTTSTAILMGMRRSLQPGAGSEPPQG